MTMAMDDVDRAKILEMRQRQEALARAQAADRETEAPLVIDGQRCCRDCGQPIPAPRLAARPQAIRCIDCKTRKEQQETHYR